MRSTDRRIRAAAAVAAALGIGAAAVTGASPTSGVAPAPSHEYGTGGSGVLTVVGSPARSTVRSIERLVDHSAEPMERLVVIDPHGAGNGTVLYSGQAPAAAHVSLPQRPAPPHDPTTYLHDQYVQRLRTWRQQVATARRSQIEQTRARLRRWTGTVAAALHRATRRARAAPGIGTALDDAAASLFSLRQAGVGTQGNAAVVIMGQMGSPTLPAPTLPQELAGAQVVVAGFRGGTAAQAAWQGALVTAGANRAVVAAPAEQAALPAVVDTALAGGRWHQPTTTVHFALGSSTLTPADTPALDRTRTLLTTTYPGATAAVIGSTDALGGTAVNGPLAVARATAVTGWLIGHGIPAGRILTEGIGPADLQVQVAPADRRALVVVEPPGPTSYPRGARPRAQGSSR